MLGTEPELVNKYVESGQVKMVFWPVINHGDPSIYATLTVQCIGQIDVDKFWEGHELLFINQRDLWRADRDYFVETAVSIGIDQIQFETCYDSGDTLQNILSLDDIRRERGIYGQPMFDIAGTIYAGAGSFADFSAVLDAELAAAP